MTQVIDLLQSRGRLLQVGFIESEDAYRTSLEKTQIVLSTSRQEFQGLAVQDAVAQRCLPVVPDDLCYPKHVPEAYRYNSVTEAVQIIQQVIVGDLEEAVDLASYGWSAIGPRWLETIDDLIRLRGSI